MDNDACIAALEARITELEAALCVAHTDPAYQILTRAGIDMRWHTRPAEVDTIIFFDLDQVREHNARWGYAGTDARIGLALAQLANNWVFRWYSGDEFGLICTQGDALGFAGRIKALLGEQKMSATFGIAPIVNSDLRASMAAAAALVLAAKARGERGTINIALRSLSSGPALPGLAGGAQTAAGVPKRAGAATGPRPRRWHGLVTSLNRSGF